ncbi:MAG TPA: hypothetical protein PK467_14520 [Candidatus Wallbacteria bacterium]|nr:hypothetical protein [Candidatus Wallbacteria bacterium]
MKPENAGFVRSLKNLIMAEMEKPRADLEIIDDMRVGDFSRPLEQFLIIRASVSEQMRKNEILESSLRDFQMIFSKSVMYLLIIILMAACYRVGASYFSYSSFIYGALSFYIIVVALCYFYHKKILIDKASLSARYRDSLYSIIKTIDAAG